MQIAATLDYPVVPLGEAATVRLLVALTPEPEDRTVRMPLDRSSVDARGVAVRFVPTIEGVTVDQLNTYLSDGPSSWCVGDLSGVAPRCLVLEIRVPALEGEERAEAVLGILETTFARRVTDGLERCASSIPVSLRFGTCDEVAGTHPDRHVTLQAAYLIVARATAAALRLAGKGEFDEAAARLVACADRLEALGLDDELLEPQLRSVRERARRMREERTGFYEPLEPKPMRTESEYGSNGGRPVASAPGGAHAVYPCYLVAGHILCEIDSDRVLVDTGAMTSISEAGSIELLGGTYRTARSYEGTTVAGIGQLVGTRISALLGADVLCHFDIRINLETGEFELANGDLLLDSTTIALDDFQGVPIVTVRMNGRDERFFFDTAAKLSYLHSTLAADWTPAGVDTDFFPGFGEFTVETGAKRIEFGGRSMDLRFATLPPLLEALVVTLSMRRRAVLFG